MAPSYAINATRSLDTTNSHFYATSNPASLLNLDLDIESPPLSPRSLYAEAVDGASSAPNLPLRDRSRSRQRHKSLRKMIGPTTEDEFDALPIAIRRKYFSTLERLRFAENPGSFAVNDLAAPRQRRLSLADRRGLKHPLLTPPRQSSVPTAKLQRRPRHSSVSSADVSWFLTLPDKIRKKQFSKEEQNQLGGRHQESVILDAADEAIYKPSRRASRNLTPMLSSPTSETPSITDSMDSPRMDTVADRPTSISKALIESFRWMDEDNNLDLRLVLDDYHANLDGVVIPSPTSNQRPSFRRHMSISKIPFGNSSVSSSKPPQSPRSPISPAFKTHSRQASRTLSMMQPKHGVSDSVSSIDPHATHYQDPEARLKLRVYLASPQKFDEAIEFGFPSLEGVTDADKENRKPRKISKEFNANRLPKSPLREKRLQTFLNDDTMSLSEDDVSMIEPESPITPAEIDGTFKPQPALRLAASSKGRPSDDFSHLGIKKPVLHKQQDSYTQALAGSREMTLRMTLTRPDLRSDESVLYGWQERAKSPASQEAFAAGFEVAPTSEKFVQGPFGGADGWGPAEKDNGVVRRIWNRVKSQRKSS